MTYNITLTANHQSLTAEYIPLAAESVQYLTAEVVYETEDWTGREIKAMFGQGCTVYEVPVTGGEITANQQLNLTAGDWRVWLVGNSARDGDVIPRITTNIAHISVAPTGGTEGNPFPAIPPTVEERLRADMGNLADLTTEDKSSLVAAINEAAASGGSEDAVTYTPQTLTEEQKSQARTNIGAEKAGTGYTKPASGIPKSDLAEDVQTSLAKADTAIQSQTIPDWNQNDDTQPDYIKNRPFYTGDPVETVLVEESTVSFAENSGLYMAQIQSSFEATVGETYKVSWDGAAYECTCVKLQNNPAIGNLSIAGAGSDTGEPFLMAVVNGQGIAIATADTSASHTFSISATVEPVVKIDAKYLPISTDDSYGVVKKADIVSAYNFPFLAEHDRMVDAITAFSTGNASIVWRSHKVIDASYDSSNDKISVVFANGPMRLHTYSNIDGFYNQFSGSSTYEELQGKQVRIVNDGVYTVLWAEGTQSDTTLRVLANKIILLGSCGLSESELILKSSTENSTKRFHITVDDSGTITATEVS